MGNRIPAFLLKRASSEAYMRDEGKIKTSFIEKSIFRLADVIRTGYVQWETASRKDLLQKVDARVKVLFLIFYVIIISLKRDLVSEALIGSLILLLAVISRLDLMTFCRKVIFLGFIFGFLIAFPSAFNVIMQGEIVFPVARFSRSYTFWVYHIPQEIGITREGMLGVLMLTLRVMNSLAVSFLVLSTTSLSEIVRALKVLRVPDSFIMIIALSYKYIFIFARTVEDLYLAKKSRLAVQVSNADARRWVAGRIAFIFRRTRLRCEEIFKAMLSRGFSDTVKIYRFRKLTSLDWSVGISLFLVGVVFLWI